MNGWINCSKGLPEEHQVVLVVWVSPWNNIRYETDMIVNGKWKYGGHKHNILAWHPIEKFI